MSSDLISIGCLSLDTVVKATFIPKINSECFLQSYSQMHGGAAANVAAYSSYFGKLNSKLLSCIGGDQIGEELLIRLQDYAVPIELIQKYDQHLSTQIITILDNDFRRRYLVYLGALDKLNIDQSTEESLSSTNLIYLAPASLSVHKKVIAIAKTNSVPIVFNPGTVYFEQELTKHLFKLLSTIDYLILNEEEAYKYSNVTQIKKAGVKLLNYGPQNVLITLEGEGAALFNHNNVEIIPGFKSRVQSSIGSGDAFSAGLITGIVRTGDIHYSIKLGNAFAAYEVTLVESRPKNPSIRTFRSFLKKLGITSLNSKSR